MVIAPGAKVVIGGIGTGVLSEELTINLSTTFKSILPDSSNVVTDAITILGTAVRSGTKGAGGFSGHNKKETAQMWSNTEPAQFSLNVEFHRTLGKDLGTPEEISGKNVIEVVKNFLKVPLPQEDGIAHTLTAPGPSVIEGLGWSDILNEEKDFSASGIVNVTIGGMKFRRLLMRKAEPTFSKYLDDSGYPISCRVAFDFISVWMATRETVDGWFE
jgi:hypothetical protein